MQAPGGFRQERASGVSEDTRVFGASVVMAERASQKPVAGAKEHAARDDRAIRQGLEHHMEHERGAFKVKSSNASQMRSKSQTRSKSRAAAGWPDWWVPELEGGVY
jgi:hypothetical protein